MTAPVRIIGIGSAFGDDCLGWELAERLRSSTALSHWSDSVSVSLHDMPGASLLQAWSGAELVILLDAVRSGAVPGTVHRLDPAHLRAASHALSTHGFGLAEAVTLAASLDSLPRSLLFFGSEADPNCQEVGLSDAVQAALPGVVTEIELVVRDHRAAH